MRTPTPIVSAAVLAAALAAALPAAAATVDFRYELSGSPVATGSFSYADGATGVLGYGDLTAFSVSLAGQTYTLADVLPLTNYVHFAYDIAANSFLVDPSLCGTAGCFESSLSAINDDLTFGFFFTGPPNPDLGVATEYTTGLSFDFDTIVLVPAGVSVPEPGSIALMGLGMLGLGALGRRRSAAR